MGKTEFKPLDMLKKFRVAIKANKVSFIKINDEKILNPLEGLIGKFKLAIKLKKEDEMRLRDTIKNKKDAKKKKEEKAEEKSEKSEFPKEAIDEITSLRDERRTARDAKKTAELEVARLQGELQGRTGRLFSRGISGIDL